MTMNVAEIASSSRGCSNVNSPSISSSTRLLGRCNSAEPRVFHELRHEIQLVKFPEDEAKLRKQQRKKEKKMKKKTRQKSITITMPDGKKVKQRKSENESMAPCPLKLALKNTDKGDVYVRADGKIVRLVKKKDKKKKEKEQKRAFKAEMKRLRKEAEQRKAEEEERQQQRQAQLQEEEAAALEMSWQEVEEQKERIFQEHWQGNKATQTDETKRSSYQEAKAVFVTKKKAASAAAVSEDEESTSGYEDDEEEEQEVRSVSSAPESALRDSSTLTFGTFTTADTTEMTPSEADLAADDDDDEEEEEDADRYPIDDRELKLFYVLEDGDDDDESDDLPFVKRMSQKSIEILAKANEMKFQSLYIEKVSDLRDERFHAVNVPKHPTQSNDYKPKNGGRIPRRRRTDASASSRGGRSQRSSSGGPAFRRTATR